MLRKICIISCFMIFCVQGWAQTYSLSGKVLKEKDKSPVEFAMLYLSDNEVWAITNEKGEFVLEKVPKGKVVLHVRCMGYAQKQLELDVQKNCADMQIMLLEANLKLEEVEVTAKKKNDELTTSYVLDRTTLEHAQILNISDVSALLPGGKTQADKNLAATRSAGDNRFSLHSGNSSENGYASFGTAVEVDGVRLQNNSVLSETAGIDTRNISSTNIESIEIVTGIPSVEYGDLSNGIVKVNTQKGKTPIIVTLSTKPHTKQAALSKGLSLGGKAGILNLGYEYTKSTSDLASPHTAYDRNALNLTYTNKFNNSVGPLTLTAGLAGNIGGYDSEADPDLSSEKYLKMRDYTLRGNVKLNWLLNKSWITNVELSGSFNYTDKREEENVYKSSASTLPNIHSMEEGYFITTDYDVNPDASIILGPTGYWYQLGITDSKPISYAAKLKADWVHRFGMTTNRLMLGGEYNGSGNNGKGLYYDDMRYAPTWRPYRYDELPFMHNYAVYMEDKVTVPVADASYFSLSAGLRSDITYIKGSEYGTSHSFSPRFNARYVFWEKADKVVSSLAVYGGWGKSVKLPSFEVLYPSTSYADYISFASPSSEDNTTFSAYHTMPLKPVYNPDLKWQDTRQTEFGVEANIKGTRISVSAYRNKTYHPFTRTNVYTPYSYKFTDISSLTGCQIPDNDRSYAIDRQTGIVTVSDKQGNYAPQTLDYKVIDRYRGTAFWTNGSTVERKGIDWVVDFAQIQALRTSFRLDGNFYFYKGVDETLYAYNSSTMSMADGSPYQYIGYYVGSNSVANGSLSRQINTNLTVTTHIPKVRLIVSLKVEASLYNYSKNLSEYSGGNRSYALESVGDYFGDTDIYRGDSYVATYPLYYSTWENPNERIPFAEKFAWAKEHDTALYTELAKMVSKSNTNYYFNPNKISSYYSANLSVTKEIGDFASLSFYATNFFNHMGLVKSSNTGIESSLYDSSYIPRFYYGLSLRLKL